MPPLAIETLIKGAVLIAALMTAAAYLVLLERWMAAWVQDRLGPNRVGIPLTDVHLFGLGQPSGRRREVRFQGGVYAGHVDRAMYFVAPLSIFVAALAAFAVVPFGSVDLPRRAAGIVGRPRAIRHVLIAVPGLDVGLIYIIAVGSMAVYGVVLGGWASNNKYGFLGGMRSSAN